MKKKIVNLGILMDPLEHIKAYKDSTVAMMESAQRLGWNCEVFTAQDLYCQDGEAFAKTTPVKIKNVSAKDWVETATAKVNPLGMFDVILMRKDPPFDMEYIYATYALELAEAQGVLVSNKPQSLRDANEKFFILNFPQCCPPTLVTRDTQQLKKFWETHQNVIFKPLSGMGGEAIFQVDETGKNLNVILEQLSKKQTVTVMAQRFIPEISIAGDKRILLIDGRPVDYALARIPALGEIRGNLAAGGTGKVVPINDRDRWICEQLAPTFKKKGLSFVGIDVIGPYLTEINITSPTCIREISSETGIDVAGDYMKTLQEQLTI